MALLPVEVAFVAALEVHVACIANEHLDSTANTCKTMDAVSAFYIAYGVRQNRSSGLKRGCHLRRTSTSCQWKLLLL